MCCLVCPGIPLCVQDMQGQGQCGGPYQGPGHGPGRTGSRSSLRSAGRRASPSPLGAPSRAGAARAAAILLISCHMPERRALSLPAAGDTNTYPRRTCCVVLFGCASSLPGLSVFMSLTITPNTYLMFSGLLIVSVSTYALMVLLPRAPL